MGRILIRLATAPGPLLAACLAIAAATNGDFRRPPTAQKSAAVNAVRPTAAPHALQHANISPNRRVQRVRIPANSLLVLQSFDLTGSRHHYHLRTSPAGPQIECQSSIEISGAEGRFQVLTDSDSDGSLVSHFQPFKRGFPLPDFVAPTTVQGPTCDSLTGKSAHLHSEFVLEDSRRVDQDDIDQRRFLLPCFTQFSAGETMVLCRRVFCGQRVAVYAANSSLNAAAPVLEICQFLERELAPTPGSLRTAVESWLGEIDDVDGDGLLTVLLSRLDHRNPADSPADFIPVLGCVRESDFIGSAECRSTGGDILYFDPAGLAGEGRRSLVSHELAHAAVHSHQVRRLSRGQQKLNLPSWFHEALAHWVEHQSAGPGTGFAARLNQFCRQPQFSPVVQPPFTHWNSARGGTRAAGLLFLEASLSKQRPPKHLLERCDTFEELLPALLGTSFETQLSAWATAVAIELWTNRTADIPLLPLPDRCSAAMEGTPVSGVLHGTSIALWRASERDMELYLESPEEADLRVLVIPEANAFRKSVHPGTAGVPSTSRADAHFPASTESITAMENGKG